jgi:hypothetical protein
MTPVMGIVMHFRYIQSYSIQLKKLFAIFLFTIHLFNLAGYMVVFNRLEAHSSRRIAERLDATDILSDQCREIRVPVNLPYHSNWSAPERINGELVIDGVHYNYVSRRMMNDTLVLLVVPNHEKTRIRHARETFFALVHEMQSSESDHQNSSVPKSLKKPFSFEGMDLAFGSVALSCCLTDVMHPFREPGTTRKGHQGVEDPPPDRMV